MEAEMKLQELAVTLDVAARGARGRVHATDTKRLSTFVDPVQHRRWLQSLLKEMAGVVDETSRGNGYGTSRQLYVWPGYDSILLDQTRVSFEISGDARRALESHGYRVGAADGSNRTVQTGALFPEGEGTDRATLYFDASLAAVPVREGEHSTFTVGGTHNWLALNPNFGNEPLLGFQVKLGNEFSADHSAFPSLVLDQARPLEWGDRLAAYLNEACGDSPENFWPLPSRRPREAADTYRDRLAIEHRSTFHRSIRQRLYSLWLIGCFHKNVREVLLDGKGRRWIERLIGDLQMVEPERAERVQNLHALERAIVDGTTFAFNPARFTSWSVVTIPYPIADTRSGESGDEADELGSGMFLADVDFSVPYCLMIRQWIASYYLSLRQQESAVMRAEREAHKAALDAEKELRRQLSHAVGTELTYVAFLANSAASEVSKDQFEARAGVLTAAIRNTKCANPIDAIQFGNLYGVPTSVEQALIDALVTTEAQTDTVERDALLIHRLLPVLPAAGAWKLLTALEAEVRRVSLENRALVRVDDRTVIAEFENDSGTPADSGSRLLTDLLARAIVVAVTVYFAKAFPLFGENGEEVCLDSAAALFGRENHNEQRRKEIAKECATEWRRCLAAQYRETSEAPSYGVVRSWLDEIFGRHSRLTFQLPDVTDGVRLIRGCGENVPLVLEPWLTEILMNALKHSRPIRGQWAVIRAEWATDGTQLKISNSTTAERVVQVGEALEADARGSSTIIKGHQGMAFLAYAARHVFEGKRLQWSFDPQSQMLQLMVK